MSKPERRGRPATVLLGLLALPLAACAPLPEVVSWEQWANDAVAGSGAASLYDGSVVGGTVDGGMLGYNGNNLFSNVARGPSMLELHCRSLEPVVFIVGDGEPVAIDCAEGGSVEVLLEASTEVEARTAGRAYWLVAARPLPESVDCVDCEADAFVDGEPVDGSVEGTQEP